MSQEEGKLVTTTVRDYDLAEVSKLVTSRTLHGYRYDGLPSWIHEFTQPLFIQSLMGLKGLYDAKPIAIHILGKPAEGDLKRPFKAAPGMFGAAAGGPQTDKAAISEAEKKVGGKKDD
ncbi:hypothetical protein BT96DRAFT_930454 [Gymnopus androsaceus JB14]|uniref:Uncharacterized protein n=1 Tax=Gymnopus androsaceus JB14 TaxID=1447944 RepID=A0A6A4IL37_9AGAR|nr:hypothetical protein BT96DRAFT_930454 [Gymnopus androsaceus JB14]